MANLDTPSKRVSSVGLLLPFVLALPFPPDGSIDQGDRQDAAYSYSGIAAGIPAVTPEAHVITVLQAEILRVPRIQPETVKVPVVVAEKVSIPRIPPEVLSC